MFSHFKRLALLLVPLTLAINGCAVNPVTGKKELSLVSSEQEIAIGAQNYQPSQQAQGGRYYIDPQIQRYVAEIGEQLASVSDRPNLPYEFVVLNNPVPNAWALPGGKIAINSGLLIHLEDEAQLAAVLAHEIVHAAARHGASQMSRGVLINAGTQIAGIAAQSAGFGGLGSVAQLGASAWMARYGRDDELESDAYGMVYMSRAGYDPYAAVELQQTFVKLNQSRQQDFVSGLFASHPPSQERVDKNRQRAATLPGGGMRNKERFKKNIAQLLHDKPAYTAQTEAVKALNNNNPERALTYLDKAIAVQPRDSYSWELKGHARAMLKEYDSADKAFSRAIERNPDYFSPYLYRGILRLEHGDANAAQDDLENSQRLLPTPAASYYLGEIASAQGNQRQAVSHYQAAAQSSSTLGKEAQKKLVLLELEQSPHKYVPSRVGVGDDGYLAVVIRNGTSVPITRITIALTEMVNAFTTGKSYTLNGPRQLMPGEQAIIRTRISGRSAGSYRAQVVSAQPLR